MLAKAVKSVGYHPILVVDDQEDFRQLLRSLLQGCAGMSVVGEAASGEEALSLLPVLRPEAVILDVQLPGINGLETAWRMRELCPDVRIVLVSAYDACLDDIARSTGAVGFLDKRQFSAAEIVRLLKF